MKKILLSASFILSLAVNAQTLTQVTHAPFPGDLFSTYQCDSTTITPGSAGAGATWNYASLIVHSSTLLNYTGSASTNTAYNPADVMVSSSLSNSSYFRSTNSDLKYYGGNMNFNGTNVVLNYASPATFAAYPMSLNTTVQSITSGTANVGFALPFNGTCTVLADATGTLVLPGRTFDNVLRVSTTQNLNVNSGFATVNQLNYDYYYPGYSKNPIFTISTTTLITTLPSPSTNTQTMVYVLKDYAVVGLKEQQKNTIDLAVFPNPASTSIHFATINTDATKIVACDVTGKVVATELFFEGKTTINLSQMNSGIYMYSVIGKNNQTLTTGKFNVAK